MTNKRIEVNRGDVFIFKKLEDEDEGKRYNHKTFRYKESYVGEKCVVMSLNEPYTVMFQDGAMWALSACELADLDGKKIKLEYPSRRKKVVCIETGKTYNSYLDAALDVGTSESNIRNAVSSPFNGRAKGYHWRKIED